MKAPHALALGFGVALLLAAQALAETPNAARGEYIFDAGGCYACHTDEKGKGAPLAGGPALQTPFGTFYAPNITPDVEFGIGKWTDAQFIKALHDGVAPDGKLLYPVFPFTAYTKATTQDLLDLRAYLQTVPAVHLASKPHEVRFPFSIRQTLLPWRWINFTPGVWQPDTAHDAAWNRGAYLVESLLHCAECHTPRNVMGGLDRSRWMAGARFGAGNHLAPNLTANPDALGKWTEKDVVAALETGIDPDGDFLGNEMAEVVKNSTSRLTGDDRAAIAVYLKALPALPDAAH